MRHIPWITFAVAAVFLVSPIGQDVIHSAFISGEGISNSIGQLLLMIASGIAVALAAVEIGIKYLLRRRRARRLAGV